MKVNADLHRSIIRGPSVERLKADPPDYTVTLILHHPQRSFVGTMLIKPFHPALDRYRLRIGCDETGRNSGVIDRYDLRKIVPCCIAKGHRSAFFISQSVWASVPSMNTCSPNFSKPFFS